MPVLRPGLGGCLLNTDTEAMRMLGMALEWREEAGCVSGRSGGEALKGVSPDIRPNGGDVGGGRCFLATAGDLDGDPLENPIAEAGKAAELDGLDQHVEITGADDYGRTAFVQVAPEDPVSLRGLLPGDEGSAVRIAGIGVAGGRVDEG